MTISPWWRGRPPRLYQSRRVRPPPIRASLRSRRGRMSYETLTETEWEAVERIWNLLDEGKTDGARSEMDALLALRPGHPELRIMDAAVALDEGEAERAIIALQGAELSADPSLFFHLRAAAHYELVELESARDDGYRALAVNPEIAET